MNTRRAIARSTGQTRVTSGARTRNLRNRIAGARAVGWASTSPTGRYQIVM